MIRPHRDPTMERADTKCLISQSTGKWQFLLNAWEKNDEWAGTCVIKLIWWIPTRIARRGEVGNDLYRFLFSRRVLSWGIDLRIPSFSVWVFVDICDV